MTRPAQLVQLGEPESLGAFYKNDGRVGHVHSDLHHGSGDEYLGLVRFEGAHGVLLLLGVILLCRMPSAYSGRYRAQGA